MRVARRAGNQLASRQIAASSAAIAAKTVGSSGLVSNSRAWSWRVSAAARAGAQRGAGPRQPARLRQHQPADVARLRPHRQGVDTSDKVILR